MNLLLFLYKILNFIKKLKKIIYQIHKSKKQKRRNIWSVKIKYHKKKKFKKSKSFY